MSRKKSKAVTDTQAIIENVVKNEVAKAELLLKRKTREAEELLHNKIVEDIQEAGAPPETVIFVLEELKEEILQQFVKKEVK